MNLPAWSTLHVGLSVLRVHLSVLDFGALALNALPGISPAWCIPVIAFATAIYTIAGGLRAVVWTEMLQLLVLIGGGIALAVLVSLYVRFA